MAGKKRKTFLIITAIFLFLAVTVYFFQFSQYGYLMTVPYRPAFTEIAGHVYINKNNARDHQEILDLIEQAKDRVRTFFGDLRFWDETVFIICDDERLTRKLGEDHAAVTISFPSEKHYILIFFSIRNRRKSDTDQGFDIRESREADTGFCATGSYGEYAAAVL